MRLGAFGRLGGILVHPRRTLRRILREGEGSIFEMLGWMIVVSIIVAPVRAGQALLLARADPLAGIRVFLSQFVSRMGGLILAAAIAALLMLILARVARKPAPGYDRCLDASMYCLIPYLVLATLGSVLSESGLELWFMPHRLLRGRGFYFAARFAGAFAWSIALFGVLAWEVARGEPAR